MTLLQRPEVQRLRRIRQLGVGHLVFPGAEHSRFGHALGAMALMQDALNSLSDKGASISPEERTAALAAALLHDVGHGPFSHTLEHVFIRDFHHEQMSRALLLHLNEELDGLLERAIQIFDNTYERPFFHQLVSSQLDMDRLDYLRRDSFFTGVVEGEVGVQRIIKTMRVHSTGGQKDAHIVVESKGIYAVENFIIARRLMYWQVYLHKTVLAGDQLLHTAFQRARDLIQNGSSDLVEEKTTPALFFFLKREIHADQIYTPAVRRTFCQLDDSDVIFSLKQWMHAEDPVLSDLARRFIHRDFFRVTFLSEKPSEKQIASWRARVADWLSTPASSHKQPNAQHTDYYLTVGRSRHTAYESTDNSIGILDRNNTVRELSDTADTAAVAELTGFVVKPYVCYPKEVPLDLESLS